MDRWNFRNVKRNILSSSRERNARRSGNPWRQQRRNGKSWRNTAEERKSLFLRRRKEAESEDKKILKMLESLDFPFRGESYKVGGAYGKMKKSPKQVSNNWLKMHGFPMRRKGRGRKSVNKCKEGRKIYTKTVYAEEISLAETKAEEEERQERERWGQEPEPVPPDYSFIEIPEGIDDELPFN